MATKIVDGDLRIVVPVALHDDIIRWYHHILGHAGQERLYASIRNHLHFPGLKAKVKAFVESCDYCQRYKLNGQGYGLLPPRDDYPAPFEEVALDHIGPWTVNIPNIGKIRFHAMTIIDIATTLLEIVRVETINQEHLCSICHADNNRCALN